MWLAYQDPHRVSRIGMSARTGMMVNTPRKKAKSNMGLLLIVCCTTYNVLSRDVKRNPRRLCLTVICNFGKKD